MSELEKPKVAKMNYEEFSEVVVGKAAALTKEINAKLEELTEYLLDELEKYAVDNTLPIPQYILDKVQREGKAPAANMPLKAEETEPVKFETLSIKVPEAIMEFLRKTDVDNEGPARWIESQIKADVKAYLDVAQPELWIKAFNLGPALKEE